MVLIKAAVRVMSIKIDCNEVIIKNNSLLQNYKNGYSKSVLDDLSVNGWKSRLLAPDYKDDFSDDFKRYVNNEQIAIYKSFVQSEFYFQLVKTIIALQKDLYTIFEKSILIEQLNKLIELFFDVLKSETDSYWQYNVYDLIQAQFEGYLFNGVTLPEPKDFTKEYVTSIVNSLLKESEVKDQEKDYTKETWFIVGLKFVDGTVYELNKDGKGLGGEDLVRGIFKNEFLNLEETEIKDLFNKYKEYVYYSLNTKGKETHSKNMFKNNSSKLKRWQILFDYFTEKGLSIDNRFHEDYKKNYRVSIY